VAQPAQWTRELNAGRLGLAGEEHLDPAAQALERLMLGVRTADGLLCARSTVTEQLEAEGLAAHDGERLRLTLEGRLLADLVVRRLASR
jgi:oxygen-independent coproporphyrinogen-3 oxidase